MGYRKIVVDNKEYEYTVGKTHVKIRGMQAVPIEQIAANVPGGRLSVTPLCIAAFIKGDHMPESIPARNILLEESIAQMKRLAQDGVNMGDYEVCHGAADDLLCKVLKELGCSSLVAAYKTVPKWYT